MSLTPESRLVILRNPVSSHADRVNTKLEALYIDADGQLERLGYSDVSIIDTSAQHDDNVQQLQALDPNDTLAVAGGDGTVGDVLWAGIEAKYSQPIAVFASGNANDIAHMLHPGRAVHKPARILALGVPVSLRPIEMYVQSGHDVKEYRAFGYCSLGFTALMADRFNQPEFRQKVDGVSAPVRLVHEGKAVLTGLKRMKNFSVSGTHAGSYSELPFVNGSRMAKLPISRQRLAQPVARFTQVQGSPLGSFIAATLRFRTGRTQRLEGDDRIFYQIAERTGVMAQVDGESFHVPRNSLIRIRLGKQAVQVTTTRRRP